MIEIDFANIEPQIKKEVVKLSDFKIKRIIGEGHQGKVVQALCKKTETDYALKIIPSKSLKDQKQIQHVLNEKNILTLLRDEPRFFPTIYNTFSDLIHFGNLPSSSGFRQRIQNHNQGQYLVFQMSLVRGVNLFKFQKHNLCLDIDIVKYFAAQSLLIIENMQQKSIVYRDIKPENLVVEYDTGHLKLIDFGFAKQLNDKKDN